MFARDAARRARKAAKERRRRQEKKRLTELSHRYEPAYGADPAPPAAHLAPARRVVDEGGPGLSTQAATPGDPRIRHQPAASDPRTEDGLAPWVSEANCPSGAISRELVSLRKGGGGLR
jgi:hypothetical protein